MQASRAIETGDASIVLVGGVESMSRAPWVLLKPERALRADHETLHSTTLGWRMVNPEMPEQWTISLGESAEKLAGIHDISREAQDEFAVRSHQRGGRRLGRRALRRLGRAGARTSSSRATRASGPTRRSRSWPSCKPAFAKDGTVTAGNASPLNDGAGALLLGDEAAGDAIGREPLARIVGRGTFGVDPDVFGIAPVEAAEPGARARRASAGATSSVVELNEAFASQSLACLQGWPELDPEQRQRQRRRDRASATRSAPPACASSARSRTSSRAAAAAAGVAAHLHRRRPGPGRRAGGPVR